MTDQQGAEGATPNKQGQVIIALLVVLIVAVAALGAVIWIRGGDSDSSKAQPVSSETSAGYTTEETGAQEQDATQSADIDLASVAVDTVHEPPVPSPPQAWGEFTLQKQWHGEMRVFEYGEDPAVLLGEDDNAWASSANHCGVVTYLVTFKAVNDQAQLRAELVDFNKTVLDSKTARSGWMLFTNCATPRLAIESIQGGANLTDVSYDVYEYRQSSVAPPDSQANVGQVAVPASSPAQVAVQPTFVECVDWTSPMALYSDGSQRYSETCAAQHEHAVKGESWCGGLYAPPEASREEFIELCGREPMYQ